MATRAKSEGPQQDRQQSGNDADQQRDATSATNNEDVTSRGARPKEKPRPVGAIATRTRSQADVTSAQFSAQSSTQDRNEGSIDAPAITINGTLQNAEQNSTQSNTTVIHRSNANADGATNYNLPPPTAEFDYRQSFRRTVRHDDEFLRT